MAKKKIQKAPKSAKKEQDLEDVEEVQERKPARGSKSKKEQLSLFSDTFNNRIEEFKNFYSEFVDLKGSENSEELNGVIKTVAGDLENACANVLQKNLVDAKQWVDAQIVGVKNQIQATSDAETNTRKALNEAGSFSQSEIEAQINLIRQKGVKLEERLEVYSNLLEKVNQISNEGGMQEQ